MKRSPIKTGLAICLALGLESSIVVQADRTLTVSQGGAADFRSINAAYNHMLAETRGRLAENWTIKVLDAATYEESVVIGDVITSSSARLTLCSENPAADEKPTIFPRADAARAVVVRRTDFVTISGFIFKNIQLAKAEMMTGVLFQDGRTPAESEIVWDHCVWDGQEQTYELKGILLCWEPHCNITVRDSTFKNAVIGADASLVYLGARSKPMAKAPTFKFMNNVVTNNVHARVTIHGNPGNRYYNSILLQGNTFTGNRGQYDLVSILDERAGIEVRDNDFHGNTLAARTLSIVNSGDALIADNRFLLNDAEAELLLQDDSTTSIALINNTIAASPRGHFGAWVLLGEQALLQSFGNVFYSQYNANDSWNTRNTDFVASRGGSTDFGAACGDLLAIDTWNAATPADGSDALAPLGSLPPEAPPSMAAANADLPARMFTILHLFTPVAGASSTNRDGAYPNAGLTLSGGALYGTANSGGEGGSGTVFSANAHGKSFVTLHAFTPVSGASSTNSDGAHPWGGLTLSGDTLYGAASGGGGGGCGTVFALRTDGTGFTVLHHFASGSNEGCPAGNLVLSEGVLFGTSQGSDGTSGAVFAVRTNGAGFTVLHAFTALSGPAFTNRDGAWPDFGPLLSGNRLYGMAKAGGSSGAGTLFGVNTDGSGFMTLHTFSGGARDGGYPHGGLVLSGQTLYGTAQSGGSWNQGTVFAINTDGTGFRRLYSLTGASGEAWPTGTLTLSGRTLYGASLGTWTDSGSVFAIDTNGTAYTSLHVFAAVCSAQPLNQGGAYPLGPLVLSGATLYGAANGGGSGGSGLLFSLSFPPRLAVSHSASNVVLTWPAHYAGFDYAGYVLQSSAGVGSSAWGAVAPVPSLVEGEFTARETIVGARRFYRLSK
ncbi:MAG: choice-of-anchor tandem repeat GloVer-containing protein [Verrucomicrobiia bacterium]